VIPSTLFTNVYPPERVWTERDPEYAAALSAIAQHGEAIGERPDVAALLTALAKRGWTVTNDVPAPDGRSGYYAFACKELPPPRTGNECIYRLGSTEAVTLTMIVGAALSFDDLLALPPSEVIDRRFPNGAGQPIAILALEPPELAARFGLGFGTGFDDVDYSRFTNYELGDGSHVLLLKHLRAPIAGTEIWADRKADWPATIAALLAKLNLTEQDLLWRADVSDDEDRG
jgi:hypothetical protein